MGSLVLIFLINLIFQKFNSNSNREIEKLAKIISLNPNNPDLEKKLAETIMRKLSLYRLFKSILIVFLILVVSFYVGKIVLFFYSPLSSLK
jgi:hypothetical protein